MNIAIASDHAAYELKMEIIHWLTMKGYEVFDHGTYSTESCDYSNFAYDAAKAVANSECDFGIVICGSGQGMQITANKVKGIRCAHCHSVEMAEITRKHNNANMVAFGSRFISFQLAKNICDTFLNTEFEGGRHQNRIDNISKLTGC